MLQIIEDRRALHKIPEIAFDLPETMAYLRAALSGLKCTCFAPIENALCAYFDFGADYAIAFRSDADALPIAEKTGLPFASAHPGKMHACGHDGHMSILLELARRLDKKPALNKNILLIFQPSEEAGSGGAKPICDTGVLEKYNVRHVFGLHLWPSVPFGKLATRKNEMMARTSEMTIEFFGRSSHIGEAWKGHDALIAGCDFRCRLLDIDASLPDDVFRLLGIGKMESGTVRNAISAYTRMEGSLRTFSDALFDTLTGRISAAADAAAATTGCTAKAQFTGGYPAVINPPALVDAVRARCGIDLLESDRPSMIAEDFSWYQRFVPSLFFHLGMGVDTPLHSANLNLPEEILPIGASYFEQIAERF